MIKFPFTTLQQFNLDWIMQQLHKILDFMPLNGSAGDVLQRTADGAAWQPITAVSLDVHALNPITPPVEAADELPIYDNDLQGNYKATVQQIMADAPVQSVNGYVGYVDLNAADVNALPDTTVIPTDTSDLTNTAGFVDAAGAAAAAPVQSVNGQTGNVVIGGSGVSSVNGQTGTVVLGKADVGLGNVDNVQQYSASNPPPYPVTSVNGQTGDVVVGGGGASFTLLWTNTNFPDTLQQLPFNAQTIALDLTGYDMFLIETVSISGMFDYHFVAKTPTAINPTTTILSDAFQKMYYRQCRITNTGIQFFAGFALDTYGSATEEGISVVPCRIWGI